MTIQFLDRCLHLNRTYSFIHVVNKKEKTHAYFLIYTTFNEGTVFFNTSFASLKDLVNFYYSLIHVKAVKPESFILDLAVAIINTGATLYQAIEQAKKTLKLTKRLATETVTFTYLKESDKTERTAVGTRPKYNGSRTGRTKKSNLNQVWYYDLERQSDRSFLASNLLF